jgi:hypothetical protein
MPYRLESNFVQYRVWSYRNVYALNTVSAGGFFEKSDIETRELSGEHCSAHYFCIQRMDVWIMDPNDNNEAH